MQKIMEQIEKHVVSMSNAKNPTEYNEAAAAVTRLIFTKIIDVMNPEMEHKEFTSNNDFSNYFVGYDKYYNIDKNKYKNLKELDTILGIQGVIELAYSHEYDYEYFSDIYFPYFNIVENNLILKDKNKSMLYMLEIIEWFVTFLNRDRNELESSYKKTVNSYEFKVARELHFNSNILSGQSILDCNIRIRNVVRYIFNEVVKILHNKRNESIAVTPNNFSQYLSVSLKYIIVNPEEYSMLDGVKLQEIFYVAYKHEPSKTKYFPYIIDVDLEQLRSLKSELIKWFMEFVDNYLPKDDLEKNKNQELPFISYEYFKDNQEKHEVYNIFEKKCNPTNTIQKENYYNVSDSSISNYVTIDNESDKEKDSIINVNKELLENKDEELVFVTEDYLKNNKTEEEAYNEFEKKYEVADRTQKEKYDNNFDLSYCNIKIRSNPYTGKNQFIVNNKPYFKNLSKKYKNEHIYNLSIEFINDIYNEFKNPNMAITFEGSKFDYDDIKALVNIFNKDNNTSISISPGTLIYDLNKTSDLNHLKHLLKSSGIKALEDKKLHDYFDFYMAEDNSVCVIATMSAGKSTLLNSFIGQKIMPSKATACTAKIVKIKANNGLTNYVDKDNNVVNLDKLIEINDDKNLETELTIKGPIRSFKDVENFELIDTPGPNNSRDQSHKTITYDYIKSNHKPMIIFLLNGSNLLVDDEINIVETIARETQKGGKIDEDRFIFVINKADEFRDADNIKDIKNDVAAALKEHGINNPKIHFISAINALLPRIEQNNCELTIDEEEELEFMLRRVKRDYYNFSSLSDLSPSVKEEIELLTYKYKESGDWKNLAVVTSGVLGLELTIKEYMNKYKNIIKVNNIQNICKKVIDKNNLLFDIQNKLNRDKKEKEAISKKIERIKSQMNDQSLVKALREEINNIKFGDTLSPIEKKINQEFVHFRNLINKIPSEEVNGKTLLNSNEAERCMKTLQSKYEHLKADLISELKSSINKDVLNVIEGTISKYQKHIKGIYCSIINKDEITNINLEEYVDLSSPDFISVVKECELEEVVISEETIKNPKKNGFWGKLKFWQDDYIVIPKVDNKKGVELEAVIDFVTDTRKQIHLLYETVKEYRNNAKEMCLSKVNRHIEIINDNIAKDLDVLTILQNDVNKKSFSIGESEVLVRDRKVKISQIKNKLDSITEF